MLQERKRKSCLICDAFFIKRDALFIRLWCFYVEVVATAREDDNDEDKGEENHEVEEELTIAKNKREKNKDCCFKKENLSWFKNVMLSLYNVMGYIKNCDALSVEVAATAREEDNEQDKGKENHEMEEEQPLPKTKGKRIKIIASKKKKQVVQ